MRFFHALFIAALLAAPPALSASPSETTGITWLPWTEDLFERAEREKKLVLLDLEAVWCHWCHVMDAETYSQPEIQKIIASNYIAVRVDQDARPDLGTRYRDYGWPATVILNPKGEDLAKRAGFIEPKAFHGLLTKLAANPVPEEGAIESDQSFASSSELPEKLREELISRYYQSDDPKLGGLSLKHKFLDLDTVEYSLRLASRKQERDEAMARLALNANFKLIDPVWGGVYQYSTYGDWDHPHYEKIMSTQTANIRAYAAAHALLRDPAYRDAAMKIVGYSKRFLLSPEGAFYTSQDADAIRGKKASDFFLLGDAERMKIGIPRVDTHRYARENGMMIHALAGLYAAIGDAELLSIAERAARWVLVHRGLDGGGFRHDETDAAGPYLGDSLEMGRAFLALYSVTGERSWLKHAQDAAHFMQSRFIDQSASGAPGFFSTAPGAKGSVRPVQVLTENIAAVRFYNLLGHYTGIEEYREVSKQAMRLLATESLALKTKTEPGILLAAEELSAPPLHITVVGAKSDSAAKALHAAGAAIPNTYKRLDWWDKAEGPMPNPDVQYPQLSKSAAFICTQKRCSLPIFVPDQIAKTIQIFEKK